MNEYNFIVIVRDFTTGIRFDFPGIAFPQEYRRIPSVTSSIYSIIWSFSVHLTLSGWEHLFDFTLNAYFS